MFSVSSSLDIFFTVSTVSSKLELSELITRLYSCDSISLISSNLLFALSTCSWLLSGLSITIFSAFICVCASFSALYFSILSFTFSLPSASPSLHLYCDWYHLSYATFPTIAAVAIPATANAAGPAAAPILVNVGANFANAPPAENAFFRFPTASTVLPAHLISPVEPFVIAPKAMTVAPVLTTTFFCSSDICDKPFAKLATVVLASCIDGNIVSPILLAASIILFFVFANFDAVVSFFALNSSCNAVFSWYAVFERLTLSVTKS